MRIVQALLVSALIILIALVVFNFAGGTANWRYSRTEPGRTIGTTGTFDTEKARERGAEIGEKAAVAANKVEQTLSDSAITAKIKTKMALDDFVKARNIGVSTTRSVVKLTGTVRSTVEHDRAVTLARETAGVTQVIDHIDVQENF